MCVLGVHVCVRVGCVCARVCMRERERSFSAERIWVCVAILMFHHDLKVAQISADINGHKDHADPIVICIGMRCPHIPTHREL